MKNTEKFSKYLYYGMILFIIFVCGPILIHKYQECNKKGGILVKTTWKPVCIDQNNQLK